MHEEIIFAGFGGQGIMFMGKLLTYAFMKEGRFVTWMPSYGAEVRGGTAHSMVVISDEEIASPVVRKPTMCVVMNRPSLKKFEKMVKDGGLLAINKSLVDDKVLRGNVDLLEVPATEIASALGNSLVSNMVMLGAVLRRKNILPIEKLLGLLKDVMPKSRHHMIPINQEALKKGYEYAPGKVCT